MTRLQRLVKKGTPIHYLIREFGFTEDLVYYLRRYNRIPDLKFLFSCKEKEKLEQIDRLMTRMAMLGGVCWCDENPNNDFLVFLDSPPPPA